MTIITILNWHFRGVSSVILFKRYIIAKTSEVLFSGVKKTNKTKFFGLYKIRLSFGYVNVLILTQQL